jgi:hypothetical protein
MTDPVLRTVFAARDGQRVGEVVYSIPNGSFCRRLPFDKRRQPSAKAPSSHVRPTSQSGRARRPEPCLGYPLTARSGHF